MNEKILEKVLFWTLSIVCCLTIIPVVAVIYCLLKSAVQM